MNNFKVSVVFKKYKRDSNNTLLNIETFKKKFNSGEEFAVWYAKESVKSRKRNNSLMIYYFNILEKRMHLILKDEMMPIK